MNILRQFNQARPDLGIKLFLTYPLYPIQIVKKLTNTTKGVNNFISYNGTVFVVAIKGLDLKFGLSPFLN